MTTKLLNRRQARWSEFLSRFDFVIQFRSGKQGAKPDVLTRRSGDLPKEGDERLMHQSQVVLKRKNLNTKLSLFAGSLSNKSAEGAFTVEELFSKAYQVDSFLNEILAILRSGAHHSNKISLVECAEDNNGRLLYRGALYVPDDNDLRLRLLKEHHDKPSAGHPGRAKTLELLSREYYWPQMRKYVDQYVKNCNVCVRSKAPRNAPYGVLRPMPIPDGPWTDVSMDFVTDLPGSDGYNAILVVVDRLTKMRHLIPTTKEADSKEVASLYIDNVWKLHGLPNTVVSDRGTQFVADFWKSLCKRLEISPRFSTAFHPQTDGQTERINAVMEQYLRIYVSYQQDDWVRWLPMAEFATNNHASETTRISPFYANSGRNPRMTFGPLEHGRTAAEDQANSIAREMKDIMEVLKSEMFRAQRIQEESTNMNRSPAPRYSIGEKVFLSTRHILTK
jgi:transposase InsO family protein